MSRLSLWRTICFVCVFCAVEVIGSPAQTFKSLVSFDGTDGAYPFYESLVQGPDGNFYGTTARGGANICGSLGCGTVFKITAGGTLTTLYSFCTQVGCADGNGPYAGLVQVTDGNFYGTTLGGSDTCGSPGGCAATCASGCATVFKITPAGTLTTLYSFCSKTNCTDGNSPYAGLVQATDGNFYGTTNSGGPKNLGTVFKITPGGTLTTLYSFCSKTNCLDGNSPSSGLVQATDGNFYGTTTGGGAYCASYGCGTVFRITTAGKLTTLHSFDSTDGVSPVARLVQATDGNFYGTTAGGGANGGGTVFQITPAGNLTTLYSFCSKTNCPDGNIPYAGLLQATDGNFYGTTYYGGANNNGTVFKITPGGTLTTLHSFDGTDGAYPAAGLLQATKGNFYGATTEGGAYCASYGCGTVFSLSVGLGPFVSFVRGTAKVGKIVEILGQGFTGTTSVSFNGTPAAFTVNSDTYLKSTVPVGATTGSVTVATPGGLLTSNTAFRVRPVILSFSPTSGPVGTRVTIRGDSLTQTTEVHFNGARANRFTVDSDTQVTATVPQAARGKGPIAVTTAGGKTWSAQNFTVTQ